MKRTAMSALARAIAPVAALVCLAYPKPASAQVKQSCTIIIQDGGVMMQSIDLQSLSSKAIGGRQGTALIGATNSSYSLSIHAPTVFSLQPPGFNASVFFNASMQGQGVTVFSEVSDDIPVRLKRGWTQVSADLVATAPAGKLIAGNYSADATLRCE